MSGWTPGRRHHRRARRRQCELYVREWDGDCGKPFAGAVYAHPNGADRALPFWHCADHREALAMDLLGMGFVVQDLAEIVTPPREPAADQ